VTDKQEFFFYIFLNKKKLHKKFPENSDRLPEDGGRRSKSAPDFHFIFKFIFISFQGSC